MAKCFLCGKGGKVIECDDETFDRLITVIEFRNKKKFRYGDLSIKERFEASYHSACMKKVKTINAKYRKDFEKFCRVKTRRGHAMPEESNEIQVSDDLPVQPSENPEHVEESLNNSSVITEATVSSTPTKKIPESCNAQSFSIDNLCEQSLESSSGQNIPSQEQEIAFYSSMSSHQDIWATGQFQDSNASIPFNRLKGGKKCIYCDMERKTVSGKISRPSFSPLSSNIVATMKNMANDLNEPEYVLKINQHQVVPYHGNCYSKYKFRHSQFTAETNQSNLLCENRALHQKAFDALSSFIQQEIVDKKQVLFLADLLARYKALLIEYGQNLNICNFDTYKSENLVRKISAYFRDSIAIGPSEYAHGKRVVYNPDMSSGYFAAQSASAANQDTIHATNVAFALRQSVKSAPTRKLPKNVSVDNILEGECDIPDDLFNFIANLVNGPDNRRRKSSDDLFKIKSICSDIIYVINKGKVRPSKHLSLGLALKSMTSSRKVLTILNRYGHTISYNAAEEFETEMTYASFVKDSVVPSGIVAVNGLHTHVAFDNFDRFVDTCGGKDTLHDTVGIIYQMNDANVLASEIVESEQADEEELVLKKRRRFDGFVDVSRSFYPKPMVVIPVLSLTTIAEFITGCQEFKNIAIQRDFVWLMSLLVNPSEPMWLGHNCKMITDNSSTQTVGYLPPINSSPTSYDVVLETLNIALSIARKCNQANIIVTYDLAIAKMAMQIQQQEKPRFDNLFVNLGAFHTQMAYFKAVGKYIDSSGLIDILVQSDVLAGGSVNAFIDSKHFNRCKRIYPLLSAALHIIHFQRFLSENKIDITELSEDLMQLQNSPTNPNEPLSLNDSLSTILRKYNDFYKSTLAGAHGKTAQYYIQFIELISTYNRFSRSIRCGNFELYIDAISEMADMFFVMNQPNYARWSIAYLSNLVALKVENSPLVGDFAKGTFGVKRTSHKLARAPVDLTLEQTINNDAANKLTGVSHFTNSFSARQRWALSHNTRTKIISKIFEDISLSRKDDVSHALKANRIAKDRKHLDSIIQTINDTVNPFSANVDDKKLFNISSGKAASARVQEFLLKSRELGCQQKERFISSCLDNPKNFDKSIKRNVLFNFAHDSVKKKQLSPDGKKRILIKMERDIFGRLLKIALDQKVDLEVSFRFPLVPVPPALFRVDGEMHKTDKSALAKKLMSRVDQVKPPSVHVEIIDGFYLLHQMGAAVPQEFGKIAEKILSKICATSASEIHIIFDTYVSPSIKDCERHSRNECEIPIIINGPLQKRQGDFLKNLRNFRFKQALVNFLCMHWENSYLAAILGTKKVFLTCREKCFSFHCNDGKVIKIDEKELECSHEEADTRIIFHLAKVKRPSNILIKATDTDILIILLGNIEKLMGLKIWLLGKTSSKNQFCINCNSLAATLGPDLCKSLPAFHAFTGCDYTASFFGKGKTTPFNIFEKNTEIQKVFMSLDHPADIYNNDIIEAVQTFTCLIYKVDNCTNVNEARYRKFINSYSTKKNDNALATRVKGFESSLIPPCWISLKEKLLRTIYVHSMWSNATEPICTELKPEDCGWFVDKSKEQHILKPTWFVGDALPTSVTDILAKQSTSNDTIVDANALLAVQNDSDSDLDLSEDESEDSCSDDE